MDDQTKHMLLMAAKAGGVPGTFQSWFDDRDNESCGIAPDGAPGRDWWNPLTNSSNAFLLSVDLEIHITHEGNLVRCLVYRTGMRQTDFTEPYGNDPRAATRLAITRSAAAIGDAMP